MADVLTRQFNSAILPLVMSYNILKKTGVFLITAISAALLSGVAFADGNCTTQYGAYGGTQCPQVRFSVDKVVSKPKTDQFVDNLSLNDAKFAPESMVSFRIKVRNDGSDKIDSITMVDQLPPLLTYVSGPGTYDAGARKITFTVSNLAPQEVRNFDYVVKVAKAGDFSQDTVCMVNQVTGSSHGVNTSDNSQICVAKNGTVVTNPVYPTPTNVKSTPATGAEAFILPALASLGAAGAFIRRKLNK